LIVLTAVSVLLPAAVLSAVAPAIVKIQLSTLTETGATVGRYSAFGTAGAIAGSVVTGFVLLSWFSTSSILVGLGVVLAGVAALLWIKQDRRSAAGGLLAAVVLASIAAGFPGPCDTETRYYCVRLLPSADGEGTFLVLDDLFHSYVNPTDPTDLEFSYIRTFAAVIDSTTSGPLRVVHVGGGGFTMPRWLETTRPGSTSRVLELDADVVRVAQNELGLSLDGDIDVSTGDARLSIRNVDDQSADVVIGDAFGGRAVPWHLTTVEFHQEIDRILETDGFYVLNVIDGAEMRFVGSMVRTLVDVFPQVAVIADGNRLERGGNVVLVGGRSTVPAELIRDNGAARGLDLTVLTGSTASGFSSGLVLTDDFAPVDQLLSR
jgi:spermidine synthase